MLITPIDLKKLIAKGGAHSGLIVRKQSTIDDVQAVGSNAFRFTISSESIDRDFDKIAQSGWLLDNYRKNPVVLWGHDASQLPIGKGVDLAVENGVLKATVEFVPANISPLAGQIYEMVKGGFLSATSVGFSPIDYEISDDEGRGSKYMPGIDFHKQELREFSIVTIPSNPDALVENGTQPDGKSAKEQQDKVARDRAKRARMLAYYSSR